ncbi:MAG TPA: hypothetical protein VID70_09580 [Solirubrobacteraceae bacterium]
MTPPADGDPGSDPTPTDELLARIIPLRHRSPQTPPPREDQPPRADREDASPRTRSIWDPAACEPVLRRRTTPATATPTPGEERAARPRIRDAALAGAAAILITVLVLSLTAPFGHSGSAPRASTALETHTATPASTPPHHSTRPHPSPHHPTTTHTRHPTIPATQPRPTAVPAPSATALTVPASGGTPPRATGAASEFSFEH